MFAICIEASHQRGMGHFYRALNLTLHLKSQQQPFVIFINRHAKSESILKQSNLPFEVVALDDFSSGWEDELIARYGITVWINDRLNTNGKHAQFVKQAGSKLVTFDDRGEGASFADLNIAGLSFDESEQLSGNKILRGVSYLILNSEIEKFKKLRSAVNNIVVSMGGSDTYGVTIQVVKVLKKLHKKVTLILGPGFEHFDALQSVITTDFEVKISVPSLIEEFQHYDLAITAGGITPFEANASGLPCIIIASEWFEVPPALFLQQLGGSLFAGHYSQINEKIFTQNFAIASMSKAGMKHLTTAGVQNIYQELKRL